MKQCRTPLIVYIVVMLAIYATNRLSPLKPSLGIVVAALFLYTPVAFLLIKKRPPSLYGIGGKFMARSVARALLLAAIVFPLYAAGFFVYMRHFYSLGVTFPLAPFAGAGHVLGFALNGLLMVAIPEEVFYRGYMQAEMGRCDGRKIRVFGIKLGVSVLITNALFAAGHLIVIPDVRRLAVFFPGLAFSWLREKDDNIAGPIVFHWLSNMLSFFLFSLLR
ncbi:MAG: CPBP family glutamic-type intramembrane protease [Deltaproteobacteria bacterium]|nr:CPBP family glutamic-type intramembrane protease [Deltaproteobacteria bacterium]MCL5277185.1 CPBP family glutamic-type intramembrane protease [Deltaproteobacteria bacterium]